MRRRTWLILCCGLACMPWPRAKPAVAADVVGLAPGEALILRTQMLMDPGLQKNAYSVLVPDHWKFQGAVTWVPALPTPYVDLSVSDPVQHAAWRQFPRLGYVDGVRENWIAAFPNRRAEGEARLAEGMIAPSGYEIRKLPATPRDYVKDILIPKLCQEAADAKDVKLVSETNLAAFAKAQSDADPLHRPIQSSRFRITYTAADGPVEREFVASLIIQRYPPARGPGPSALWFGDVTTCRAPLGKLDALLPTFTTIGSSVTVQLPWFNQEVQVAEMFLKQLQQQEADILRDQRDAINARMQILRDEARQASDLVSQEVHQRFAEQQAVKAAVQTEFMQYINNTAAYKAPNGGPPITLDANYRYQYIDEHGDVIQTDDPTYKLPNGAGTSWQPMQRAN